MVTLAHRGRRGVAGLGDIVMSEAAMTGPQPPILPLSVPRTGTYKAARLSPADGSCATHPYPCYHPGVDCGGVQGTVVRAPEDGIIVFIADGSAPPWVGYGPFLVLIQGKSGYFHLLAHLQPGSVSLGVGSAVTAGMPVATTSSENHTHWEVRKKVTPNYAANETNLDNNLDPMAWLSSARAGKVILILLAGGAAIAMAMYLKRRR
jgi:murein DD-endopeptidase MepM/ murein hydrolase activator NlpD